MRLILRHRAWLHTRPVSSLIPSLQAKIDSQQRSRLLFFERVFEQLHYQHTLQQKNNQQMARRLRTICLMDPKPVQKITEMFFAEAQEFNQEFLTQAWVALSKAHIISYIDNDNTLDLAGRRLLYTAQFRNMTQEIKYGLKKRKISFWNMISIMEGCVDIGYVDYEIFSLLIDETKRVMSRNPDLKSDKTYREFQLEKKNYHDEMELPIQNSILHSEQFRQALKIVRDKVKEKEAMNTIKGVPIAELIGEVQQTGKNFEKLAEGIISTRRGYRKMVQISNQEYIERRPAINLELLELEEYLLSSKIINMHDIKHPQLLSNEKYEAERCQQVLLSILNVESLETYRYLVQPISVPPQLPDLSEEIHRQIAILRVLADMALVDNRVYCIEDGRSLISIQWEKTLVKDSTADDKARQDLRVARVFRRVYREVMPLFQSKHILLDRFKNRPLQERIELYVPFLKMGCFQQVIKNMEAEILQPLNLSDFSDVQFMSLIYVLNNICDSIDMSSWSNPILQALTNNIAQESIGLKQLPLTHVIDCLNLMIQLGQIQISVESSVETIYEQYLKLIEQQAAEFNGIHVKSNLAVEAYKILALSIPEKHLKSSIYSEYIQQINSDQSLFNPYMEVFRDTYFKVYMKGAKTVGGDFPFLKIGFDSSTGQERAILIISSDDTSLDGKYLSGNQKAFVLRLEQAYNVAIQVVPVNLFVTPSGPNQFTVAKEGVIRGFFDGLLSRKDKSIKPALEKLEHFGHSLSASSQTALFASKWKIQLSRLKQLLKLNSGTQNIEQTLSVEAQLITLLLEFVKDAEMLELTDQQKTSLKTILFQSIKQIQDNIKTIQSNISASRKQAQSETNEDPLAFKVTKLTEVLAEDLEVTPVQTSPVETSKNDDVHVKPLQLKGRRLSLQTLLKPSRKSNDFVELIDNLYYLNKTYLEYSDWGAEMQKVYDLDHFEYRNLAPMNKILVCKYLGRLVNCISLLPFEGRTEKVKIINVSLRKTLNEKNKFQTIYPNKDAELKRRTADTLQASLVLRPKIIIQNLKHELKLTKKPEGILSYIFSSSYVQKLLLDKPKKQIQGIFLERDVNEYFNHLERRHDRAEIISPNIEYVLRKLENVTEVKCLLQKRQIIRQKSRELFKVGAISKQHYYAQIDSIEKRIIAGMERIKTKALDHMKHNILDGGLRIVSIEIKDINIIKDWFANFKTYDRTVDIDYVFDKENAINNKRARAQSNFIKFYILHKICKKQHLSQPCIQFLNEWHADVNNLECHKIETTHTEMKFKDLSEQEQLLFETSSFKLQDFSNLYLIDFILEMSQFFDYKFLAEVQNKMKAEKLTAVYGIPADLFKSSRNNQLLLNTYEQERAMLNNHSQLTTKDMQQFIEMVSVFKTEAYLKRKRFETVYSQFKSVLQRMNLQDQRNELMLEYIRALDNEFFTDYEPKRLLELKDQGACSLWMDVFGVTPEQTSNDQIKSGVGKLCLRIAAMGSNPPPFFGDLIVKIMQHPKTGILVKQHIIATLEKYKVPLRLDTLAIEQLVGYESTKKLQVLKKEAKSIANKQIVEKVAARLNSLLSKKELKKTTDSDPI